MSEGNAEIKQNLPEEYPDIAYISVNPTLTDEKKVRQLFDAYLKTEPKAIVLKAYATGTTPTAMNPVIQECSEKGIPVFLLSDNPGDEKGIQKITYEAQVESLNAGVIPLKDVNSKHLADVLGNIQLEVNNGKIGNELKEAVIDKFGIPPTPPQPHT